MLKTETTKMIVCDVCRRVITRQKVHIIRINDFDWHFCGVDFERGSEFLNFLTINVGLDIKFSVSEKDYNEILNNEPSPRT